MFAGDIVAGRRPQEHHHRRHALRPGAPDRARAAWSSPSRSSTWRSSRRPRPTRTSWARRSARCPRRTRRSRSAPTTRPARRSSRGMGELHLEVLVDRMMREFSGRRQRRQAAGRLPRDDHQAGREGRGDATSTRPVARGQYGHVVISLEPTGPGGGYEFVDKITGGVIPSEYIPAVDAGIQEALEGGVLAGYPLVDVRAILTVRLVPRRRLLGDGVQDRRLDGVQEGGPQGQARRCSSRSWRSRSSPPRTTWATSSATSLAAGARSEGMEQRGNVPGGRTPECRWPRCSAMLPTSGRAPRGARRTRCSSTPTSRCRVDRGGDRQPSPRRVAADHPATARSHHARRDASGSNERRRNRWPRRSSSGTSRT